MKKIICYAFLVISIIFNPYAVKAQLVLESLNGPVTANEINGFKSWAQKINISSSWAPTSNQMSYGTDGRKMEALGIMYELTREKVILDGLIRYTDGLLKYRNNPVTGTFEWTGERELIWLPEEVRSGAEQGLIVAKIAYAAQLILQTPSLWNQVIPDGNPNNYGTTYKERALKYVQEMELTESTYLFKWYVRASDKQLIFPNDPRSDAGPIGGNLPFNQKWMMMFGKMRMAKCHELLGNTALATKYKEVVQANLSLYSSQMYPVTYQGKSACIWYYPVNNTQYVEDIGHAQHGITGMMNLDILGGYTNFPDRAKMGNAILYANYRASDNSWNHNVAGTNVTWYRKIQPGFIFLSKYVPELYDTIGTDLIKESVVPTDADAVAYVLWAKNARYTGNWNSGINSLPSVSITSPASSSIVNAPGYFTINATASDSDGSINKVDFYNGTVLLGSDNTSPYSFNWSNVPAGTYTITAKATDNVGSETVSASVTINVNEVTNGVATVFKNCNFSTAEYVVVLSEGDYTTTQLIESGISNNDISSIRINSGYEIVLYDQDNFQGTSLVLNSNVSCLTANSFNDLTSSIKIRAINNAPSISITSPANNTVFTAPAGFTITASAADADGTISKVEFYRGTTKLGEDVTSPYSLSVGGLAAGSHALTAKTTDDKGAVTTSAIVNIIVNALQNQTPTVTITSPVNNTSYTVPANITINATAADADGTVSKVEFFNGTTKISEDVSSPFSFVWINVVAGSYSITAKVTDNLGATGNSVPITIIVNAPSGCSEPQYKENGGYAAGSKVQNAGGLYECKPWPYSGWCNGAGWAYAPGTGAYWQDAWIKTGNCVASKVSAQSIAGQISGMPNPFDNTTEVSVNLEESGDVSVTIFDQLGREVEVLANGYFSADKHTFTFNGNNLQSGIYICRLVNNGKIINTILVKQ